MTPPPAPHTSPWDGKRGRGRPPKFTPEAEDKILKTVRATGLKIQQAAALAGVDRKTVYDWLQKGGWYNANTGRGGKGTRVASDRVFGDFCNKIDEAYAAFLARNALAVTAAGQMDWRAAAWALERAEPGQYGRSEPRPLGPVREQDVAGPSIVDELRAALDDAPPRSQGGDDEESPEDEDEEDA